VREHLHETIISFRVSNPMKEHLVEIAKSEDRTLSQQVRYALREWLKIVNNYEHRLSKVCGDENII
jgi:predicted transcriptional regulator